MLRYPCIEDNFADGGDISIDGVSEKQRAIFRSKKRPSAWEVVSVTKSFRLEFHYAASFKDLRSLQNAEISNSNNSFFELRFRIARHSIFSNPKRSRISA